MTKPKPKCPTISTPTERRRLRYIVNTHDIWLKHPPLKLAAEMRVAIEHLLEDCSDYIRALEKIKRMEAAAIHTKTVFHTTTKRYKGSTKKYNELRARTTNYHNSVKRQIDEAAEKIKKSIDMWEERRRDYSRPTRKKKSLSNSNDTTADADGQTDDSV